MAFFDVSADAYGKFMGRYSEQLAVKFADYVDLDPGRQVLDVGCGPGALTAVLVSRLGVSNVAGVDPSESFVSAVRARLPGLDVRQGRAEDLPFEDDEFDATLAQLVVHFMDDPVAGITEMGRVTKRGGRVAACVWDHRGGSGPLAPFWTAVREADPNANDEGERPGTREGHLAQLFDAAGLHGIESTSLTVTVTYAEFDDWWMPFTLGVGPAGEYVAGLDDRSRAALRERCEQLMPRAPFDIHAKAWTVVARA